MNALHRLALLILALLAGAAAVAQTSGEQRTWRVDIGDDRLSLPVPAGYIEATRVSPQLRQIGERLTPPTNRLLAYLLSDEDVEAVRSGIRSHFNRYFAIQTLRQTEHLRILPEEFAEVRTQMRSQYKQALPRVAESMQSYLDSVTRELQASGGSRIPGLRLGEMRGLEVFVDERDAIGLLALSSVVVQDKGSTNEVPMAAAITTALIADKVVFFYAYSKFGGMQDLDWVRAQTLAWLKQAKEQNR